MLFKDRQPANHITNHICTNYYIEPNQLLKPYIAHYTISVPNDVIKNENLNLIPDAAGCIIFTYDGNTPSLTLWGATTKAVTVTNNGNKEPMRLFIEFMPGGLQALTGWNQNEFTDLQLPLEQVSLKLSKLLAEIIEKTNAVTDLTANLNNIFLRMLQNNFSSPLASSILWRLHTTHGLVSVKALSEAEHWSERHLNRVLHNHVGMSIKTLARIIRINHTLQRIKASGYCNFTNLAGELGYYDQAHFIHDFKGLCGTTPTEYINNMSDFYNEIYKF